MERTPAEAEPVNETVTTIITTIDERSIYDVLKQEHKQINELFKQILDKCVPSADIFNQIKVEWESHMAGEEKYFYPAIKQGADMTFLVDEAFTEHNVEKTLMTEVGTLNETDEMWLPKVKVLCDMIHHQIEKEEGEVFKGAKKILSKQDEKRIARLFENEKMDVKVSQKKNAM